MSVDPFRPNPVAHSGTSLHARAAQPALERLVWKLLLVTAFTYVIWNERIVIQIGPAPLLSDTAFDQAMRHQQQFWALGNPWGLATNPEIPLDSLCRWTVALDPGFARRHQISQEVVKAYQYDCQQFIRKLAPVAIAEMRRFQIPASILMAQAILESDAGAAGFVADSYNYFPRSCSVAGCVATHYSSADGTIRHIHAFSNLWESFRVQCRYLSGNPALQKLIKSGVTTPNKWAEILQQQHYSTDVAYAAKLAGLIKVFQLESLDVRARSR